MISYPTEWWQVYNMDMIFYTQKTPYNSPLQTCYGQYIVYGEKWLYYEVQL